MKILLVLLLCNFAYAEENFYGDTIRGKWPVLPDEKVYIQKALESDEYILAFKVDPTPIKNYKETLLKLVEERKEYYRKEWEYLSKHWVEINKKHDREVYYQALREHSTPSLGHMEHMGI